MSYNSLQEEFDLYGSLGDDADDNYVVLEKRTPEDDTTVVFDATAELLGEI